MTRRIPLVAALFAAAFVIPITAAQAADSGLTPTVSRSTMAVSRRVWLLQLGGPDRAHKQPGSDVTLSAGVDTVTSSNDTWDWISVGGSPYPAAFRRVPSSSRLETPAPSCPTSRGRVCSVIRPPLSPFIATREPPTSRSLPPSKHQSPSTCPTATCGSRKSSARPRRPHVPHQERREHRPQHHVGHAL